MVVSWWISFFWVSSILRAGQGERAAPPVGGCQDAKSTLAVTEATNAHTRRRYFILRIETNKSETKKSRMKYRKKEKKFIYEKVYKEGPRNQTSENSVHYNESRR
jgi:hypothetical protein